MQVSGWLSTFLNYEQFALFAVKATVYFFPEIDIKLRTKTQVFRRVLSSH